MFDYLDKVALLENQKVGKRKTFTGAVSPTMPLGRIGHGIESYSMLHNP
jgi:hypothetical protein